MEDRYSLLPTEYSISHFVSNWSLSCQKHPNIIIHRCGEDQALKYRLRGIFDHGREKSNLNFPLLGVCTGFTMKFPAQWFWQKLKFVKMQLIFQLKSISNQLQLIEITSYWQICVNKATVIQPSIQILNFVLLLFAII